MKLDNNELAILSPSLKYNLLDLITVSTGYEKSSGSALNPVLLFGSTHYNSILQWF
jgi:hypothetical protein